MLYNVAPIPICSNFKAAVVAIVVHLVHPCYNHLTIQVTTPAGLPITLLSPSAEACKPYNGDLTLSGNIPAARRRALAQDNAGNSNGDWSITVAPDPKAQEAQQTSGGSIAFEKVTLPSAGG